ncbi:hypothetical protein D9619_011304 [Psilocybe cf. subviscida]|uniref:Nephrocystin 3-like N-terminal domain-containing protein n=1 Tax=Psilocybe cf. subviscida TaxID=2480587 RepID=A0A8H5F5M5_9AGAR|nr:hypothetical protein D9619_011304 [Psilocybe cf. subviscida]
MASILNNAQNTNIHGGTFIINDKKGTAPSLDVLYKRVASNAILNAGGRADEVRCHPGTRKEVISRIEKWRDAPEGLTTSVFWLSGPFGAGKSAIVQTIAERCNEQGAPQANFFFFRTDISRNSVSPLVATLLHQVILLYPSVRETVATVLSANPLIFDCLLEEQLAQLIVVPLRAVQKSSASYRPLVLLIDGLDECDSDSKAGQQRILRAFDNVLVKQRHGVCLFRLLVASRVEPQISMSFKRLSTPFLPLYLNDDYSPETDIRLFITDEFKKVKSTHLLAYTLDETWPSVEDIDGIVEKSSGQFIYAATVMRFISNSSASPMLSLGKVQGVSESAGTSSPFSQLDAIYTYILSRADDQQALKDIFHAHSYSTNIKPQDPFIATHS